MASAEEYALILDELDSEAQAAPSLTQSFSTKSSPSHAHACHY